MNGNDGIQKTLIDHEVRITKLEKAVEHIYESLRRIEHSLDEFRFEMRAEHRALRESFERSLAEMRQEFHRDRRFAAMIFLTTQLAVIGALLKLAGIL